MGNPTIQYDGLEIPDFGEREYPYGIIEVTKRCNLRCTTCFFFQAFQHEDDDLPEDELLAKLRALQKRHNIRFMSWVGGEPLLRRRLIEAAPDIFPRNVMFTNGMLPIPETPIAIGVSLDGPPEINDAIRGKGVYEKVHKRIADASRPVFIQSVVTQRNAGAIEEFTADIASWPNVLGVIYSIYVPQKDDESGLGFPLPERDRLLAKLIALKDEYGAFIMNERRALELAHSSTCSQVTDHCDMKANSLALDYRLRRRTPCCYGEAVDCDLCAAPTPFSIAAKRESHAPADTANDVPPPDPTLQQAIQGRA